MMIDVVNAHPRHRVPRTLVRRCVRGALSSARRSQGAITVIFTDDRMSRRLNRRFLGHDRPTDVIAFPLGEGSNLEAEIYVNIEKARRQARTYHVTAENDTARLIIHGTLHLLGYDDRTPADARRMRAREDVLVSQLAWTKEKEKDERKSR
jgi:probable rRNA maturation factor